MNLKSVLTSVFKHRRHRIIGIILLVIIVLLSILPSLVKRYTVNHSLELFGRQIAIDKLRYNYFTSTARVFDFKLFEPNNKEVFVSFDTLIINLEPLKYFSGTVEVEQFYVKGLSSMVIMQDSTFNFDDLIAFHTPSDSMVVKNTKETSFKYAISNIELKDANFYFDNKNVDKLTEIEHLNLAVPFIGWDQEEKSNADIKFNFKNGGYFQSSLNIHPGSGEFDADLTVKQLTLDPFYKYVQQYAEINDFNGSVDAHIFIEGNAYEGLKSIVSGTVDVYDFEMTDTNNKKFLGAESISCDLEKIDYYNSNYQFESLEVNNSYTFFQLDSMSNNFFRIFKLEDDLETIESKEQTELASTSIKVDSLDTAMELTYELKQLLVNNGVLDYTDNLTGEAFNYHLSDIKINSKDITNAVDWLSISSTMLLNDRGNLIAEVGLNPNDYYRNLDLNVSVENFLLPDLNIYTNYYMGHSVLEGDMYYYSKSKVTNGLITSENKLLVKNAKLETSDAGLYSLPLKFAFFLLTDKNGDVNLEVPVRGDINDPSVKVGTIVWTTFKNVIGKTVAAPVTFLVGLVGGDPKELEEMTFAYTDTIPSDKHYRQLNKLLDLEQKKDELAITMTFYADQRLQKEALAKALIGEEFNSNSRDYQKDEAAFKEFIYNKVGTDSLSINTAVLQLTRDSNLDSLISVRHQKLIKSIDSYLHLERPDTKITIKQGMPDAPENVGSYPRFLFTYGMQDDNKEPSEGPTE